LSALDELAVSDGWPGGRSAEQEIGQIGDASAAIEAVVPLARIARQMLGADTMEGAVEPGFQVAEQDMDDGQRGIGVFAAVLDDRVVAEAIGEAVVALQTKLLNDLFFRTPWPSLPHESHARSPTKNHLAWLMDIIRALDEGLGREKSLCLQVEGLAAWKGRNSRYLQSKAIL
jgi:hypothetical protein